ncbi:MAG: phosphoribosylformylglycinamidine synthase, partial [Christensenellaceae bacterium]
MINRIFVEKKDNLQAKKIASDLKNLLRINVHDVREVIRYDVEGLDEEQLEAAIGSVFSEPPVDNVYREELTFPPEYKVFAYAYLTGQYDQRADSAAQCVQLLTIDRRPLVKCAHVVAISGITDDELPAIKKHLINPVEAEEVSLDKPVSLAHAAVEAADVREVTGFIDMTASDVASYHKSMGFAMSVADLIFVRDYFMKEGRNPTETEIKVIDTYWSDHCRHTTFSTEIKNVEIRSDNPHLQRALDLYEDLFAELYATRTDKYRCLMDIATIAVKKLKKIGRLNNLDVSDEINACSICVDVVLDGKPEKYLIMFKNETHNHPTEIEPFGGAATCLGGAIRDP